jgi:hypothetical protein
LNKRRAGKLVRHGGFMSDEAQARATNAQPWQPPPGMIKQQCPECRYFFAAATETGLCPDCAMPRRNIHA